MCGIIGYLGNQDAVPLVKQGLQNLEYRGYDSAGVAVNNDDVEVYKQSGQVEELTSSLPDETKAACAIGHTRWSTHGPPTDTNAHPHTGCNDEVAVVHNGIIENYDQLREELSEHEFTSDTDTEVIPHLIESYRAEGKTTETAIELTTERLQGSYAFAATVAGEHVVYAAREESPLVVGHGDNGVFLASDVPAFLEETKKVTYLQDGDIAKLTSEGGVSVRRQGEWIRPDVETVDWDAEAAEKGGYEHYMLKEIHEQPTALRQSIPGRVNPTAGKTDLDLSIPVEYLQSLDEIQIIACGTSYYAGEYAARLFESLADLRTSVSIASEYEFNGGRDPWRTLGIAVTQSGETADTLGALQKLNDAGAKTVAVTNTLGSSVTREVAESVYINAGPEIGVAATKTFATQVATLAMIAVEFGRTRGVLSRAEAQEVLSNLREVPAAVQQVLDNESTVKQIATAFADKDAFFFIGRDLGYPVALEGALKLKEISYEHAEGFAAGELKHGPLALVTEDSPVLAVLTRGACPDETQNNIKEVQARGAPVIGASSGSYDSHIDRTLPVPEVGRFEPLVANVYWQLFAYYVAKNKDKPIDKPRNLAKSVTVK